MVSCTILTELLYALKMLSTSCNSQVVFFGLLFYVLATFRTIIVLQVAEDERYDFTSSMLGLLAEYSIWPRVINASTLSNNIKV